MPTKLKADSFNRGLVAETKLAHLVDREIERMGDFEWDASFRKKKPDNLIHPSSHCLLTPYELYMALTEPQQQDYSASLRKAFCAGHFYHQYIQYVLVKAGFAKKSNIERHRVVHNAHEYTFNPAISAAADAVVDLPSKETYLVDIKTMHPYDFSLDKLPQRFERKYIAQINIYLDIFNIDNGLFLCVDKGSGAFKEIVVQKQPLLVDALYQKFQFVGESIYNKIPPPKDFDIELPFAD
jgi:hypothetical protein